MEMRGGFMRPRERGGLMRPLVPLRGRGVMGMERMRLGPPLRPGLMRGGPPVPFVGRGMIPPHVRPRGMGPVMLPRPPMPPPGPMGPLGPRGMLPRPMLPPRPLGPDMTNLCDPSANSQIPVNGLRGTNNQLKNVKDNNFSNKNTSVAGQNQPMGNRIVNRNIKVPNRVNKGNLNAGQVAGLKKNRSRNRRQVNLSQPPQQLQPHQQMQIPTQPPLQPPVQNMHPVQHHSQPPPQQSPVGMNSSQMQKHMHPMQQPLSSGSLQQPSQLHPMQQQPSYRGNRNGMNPRNRGAPSMGHGGLINTIPVGSAGRGNVMNRGGPNLPHRGGGAPMPSRGNSMLGGPPPLVQYSSAPPSSYAVPPPNMGSQIPVKRGGPPMGVPPVMQPKRIRYDSPLPANGYHGQYQQQQPPPPPPPQQAMYSSYDVPPPMDAYNAPPAPNVPPIQSYHSADYDYAPVPQNNNSYSSYNNAGAYSGYSTAGGYDSSTEYSAVNTQSMNNAAPDPYAYAAPVDSYGYSNFNYSNSQTGFEDYNTGYVDAGGYAAPVQDPTYGQSVGTYSNYSY